MSTVRLKADTTYEFSVPVLYSSGVKTLAFFLVLLLQAPPVAPPAGLPAALRQLREHLDEHRATLGASPELTAAKHQFRDWVESRLASLDEGADIRAFAGTLSTALAAAGLFCGDLSEECDWNFLGYVDDVRVSRAGEFLVVVTAIGNSCGFDESAYVYAWQSQQWRRVWEHERNTYTPQDYLPQIIHDVQISPPDASRSRLLMTLGSQTICGGAFKDLYARVWRMDPDYRSTPVLDWTAHANDAYPPIQGRIRPDAVLFQFTAGGLLSGEVHTAVRHFTIDQGTANAGRSHRRPAAGFRRRVAQRAVGRQPRPIWTRVAGSLARPAPQKGWRRGFSGSDPPVYRRPRFVAGGNTLVRAPEAILSCPLAEPLQLYHGRHQRNAVSRLHRRG